jgi:RNA polymerase sigma factor (sigma-70 family)
MSVPDADSISEPPLLSENRSERPSQRPSLDSLSLLEALPPEQRAAIRGRVIERREYAELAQQLECSELVVRQHVSRGLRALRLLLGLR